MAAKTRICVVGSSNIDLVMLLDQLPARGETVIGGKYLQVFGGKGANQAVAAARAGGAVSFVTCLGDDPATSRMLESFLADGMDLAPARRLRHRTSGTAMIMVDASGNNYLAVDSGTNADLDVDMVNEHASVIASADVVIVQNEIPAPATLRAIELARDAGKPVVLNYAPFFPGLETARPDVIVLNENEASGLSGVTVTDQASARTACQTLAKAGHQNICITLGGQGVLVWQASRVDHVPAISTKVVDTTAAGDTWCGALAVAMGEGLPLETAARFATAAASISVGRAGAQPSIPTRSEIDALCSQQYG
jgi:ribokinase